MMHEIALVEVEAMMTDRKESKVDKDIENTTEVGQPKET